MLEADDLLLFPMWFVLDTNAVPATYVDHTYLYNHNLKNYNVLTNQIRYVLQSVSKFIPGFLSKDPTVSGSSRGRWWGIFGILRSSVFSPIPLFHSFVCALYFVGCSRFHVLTLK